MAHEVDDDTRMLMIGTVTKINPEEGLARVLFEDKDKMTSKEIPVLFNHTNGLKIYAMPEIGEQVVCCFLANGLEEGYIIGAYYDDIDTPPVTDPAIKVIKFKTGDYIQYNDNTGEMAIKCSKLSIIGDANISGNLGVTGTTTSPNFVGDLDGLANGVK